MAGLTPRYLTGIALRLEPDGGLHSRPRLIDMA
jgi:hypothetical protein